jgi:hypothetical protein
MPEFSVIDILFNDDIHDNCLDFILKYIRGALIKVQKLSINHKVYDPYIHNFTFGHKRVIINGEDSNLVEGDKFPMQILIGPIEHCTSLLNEHYVSNQVKITKRAFILVSLMQSSIIPILFSTHNTFTKFFHAVRQSVLLNYIISIKSQYIKLGNQEITESEFVDRCKNIWRYNCPIINENDIKPFL